MQTAYNYFPGAAIAGMLYDADGDIDVVTRTGAANQLMGIFLVKALGDGNVAAPSVAPSSSSVVDCVSMFTQDIQSTLGTPNQVIPTLTAPFYPAGRPINGLQRGRIWVYCGSAFNPDTDTAYLRYTISGSGTSLPGYIDNYSDSGKNAPLGVSGFLVPFKALNTLTAAGLLALDVLIPGTVH